MPGRDGYREREVELEWSMLQVYCVINICNKSVLDQDNTGLWIILIYKWPGSSISAICFILWRRNRYHVNQVWKWSVVLWEHDGWIFARAYPSFGGYHTGVLARFLEKIISKETAMCGMLYCFVVNKE